MQGLGQIPFATMVVQYVLNIWCTRMYSTQSLYFCKGQTSTISSLSQFIKVPDQGTKPIPIWRCLKKP